MSASPAVDEIVQSEYEHGFVTQIDSDTFPPGLDEGVVRAISARKGEPEFLLEYRLKAFRHWQTMATPKWAHVHYPEIDYQAISYFSAPNPRMDPRASTKSTRPCSRPTTSSASQSRSRWPCPASR